MVHVFYLSWQMQITDGSFLMICNMSVGKKNSFQRTKNDIKKTRFLLQSIK